MNKIKLVIINWMSHSNIGFINNPKSISIIDHLITTNFIKYLIIGVTTLSLDFIFYYLLDTKTPLHNIYANMTSTFLSLGFNFYMSNFWTFKAGGNNKMHKLGKYTSLAIFNYIFTNVFFYIVNVIIGVPAFITKIIATAIIVSWNYFLYKLWIFKADSILKD